MHTGFVYLLLNAVIGFDYCHHWNLTHKISLGKVKMCVQLIWNGYYKRESVFVKTFL